MQHDATLGQRELLDVDVCYGRPFKSQEALLLGVELPGFYRGPLFVNPKAKFNCQDSYCSREAGWQT